MRESTYRKIEGFWGYIRTEQLLTAGITNRQIGNLTDEGVLEKVCHGYYWVNKSALKKPKESKAIEVCLSDPRAVICADSACYYLGLIKVEPDTFSVATSRKDRRVIKMNFPIKRYYFSESYFEGNHQIVTTDFGGFTTFDIDRSVCDCIRFRKNIDTYIFDLIIDTYKKKDAQERRIEVYASKLRMLSEVRNYF